MKTTPVIKSMDYLNVDSELRQCLLIDIGNKKLLVPRVLVVELIDYDKQEQQQLSSDISLFSWRGVKVPLISSEFIDPEYRESPTSDSKIVIFHGVETSVSVPFYAIISNRNPRLLNLSQNDIIELSSLKSGNKVEQMCVEVNAETAIIPQLDYLEKYIYERCTRD